MSHVCSKNSLGINSEFLALKASKCFWHFYGKCFVDQKQNLEEPLHHRANSQHKLELPLLRGTLY